MCSSDLAVPDSYDDNDQLFFLHLVYDAILISDFDTVIIIVTVNFLASIWKRIAFERLKSFFHLSANDARQPFYFFLHSRMEDNDELSSCPLGRLLPRESFPHLFVLRC